MEFQGFPVAALDFYDDLEVDNTKSFWEAHKHVYAESVRAPMTALCASLEPEFGKAKIFRPYRDVRFAKDKTPYKTHQGAYVGVGPATGWYVEISPRGLRAGDPHPRGAGPGARGLAHAAPVRGVGPAARPGLSDARPTTRTRSSSGVRSRG